MSRRIVTLSAASLDFLEAIRHYAERNVTASERLANEYDRVILRIEAAPLTFPSFVDDTFKINLRKFPYSVIYRVLEDEIRVIAFAHHSRRPGFWLDRI